MQTDMHERRVTGRVESCGKTWLNMHIYLQKHLCSTRSLRVYVLGRGGGIYVIVSRVDGVVR